MQIPGYKIESKLGQGGMAEVYLAIQESLGRQVALKITSPWQSQDPAFKERFMQEGRIVATLNHPNIVTIHEIGQVDEQYFIAMEYVSGKSLTEKIEEGMTLEESVQTVKRIARALAYAHNGGFLHRDIKPSNILFRDDEYAVLADFGIARALVEDDTRLTQTGMSPGSPAYMSPEQVNGLNLDARSDQYSLGIVFYEMLTGDRPYKGNSATATAILHLTAPVPQLPHPYESLQPIFDRLLAKTPEERFADEEALIQALDEPGSVEPKPSVENDSHAATALGRTQVRMDKTRVANPSIVQKPKGEASGKRLLWGGVAAFGAVALAGMMFWFQTDGLVQDDKQDTVASLSADEAKNVTIQETDSKEAAVDSTDTEEPVDTQTVDAESKNGELPEQNGQQVISLDSQEPTDLKQADIEPKVAPMPGLNGRESNSSDIQEPDSSQVAKTEVTQEPEVNEVPMDSSGTQEPTDSQPVDGEPDAAKTPELSEEQPDSLDNQKSAESKPGSVEPDVAQAPESNEEQADSSENQKLTDSPAVNVETETAQASALNEEQTGSSEAEGRPDTQVATALMEADKAQEEGSDAQEFAEAKTEVPQVMNGDEGPANMLATARDQMAAERYVEPAGDNAFETYTEVLKEDAENEAAMNGLTQIAEYYEEQARLKQNAGEFEQSLALLDLGLRAAPKNSNLIALNNEVTVQYEKQQTEQQIDALMQKAESQMASQRLARPKGDNAYESYQAILALDASHQQAQKGVQEIASRYATFAQTKRQTGDLSTGLAMADRGLEVAPEHEGLLALRKEISSLLDGQQASEAKQQATQAEIERLLANAQQQLDANQLTQPKGKNARESYNAVLKMAPENQQARTGLNAISQRYDALTRDKQSAGDVEAAFRLVEEGLQVFPKHSGLRTLHKEIKSQLEAAKQAQKTPIEPQPIAKKPNKKRSGARVFGTF